MVDQRIDGSSRQSVGRKFIQALELIFLTLFLRLLGGLSAFGVYFTEFRTVDMQEQLRYKYFLGSSGFSLYEAMSGLLEEQPDWLRETNANRVSQCSLVLGDRFDIPYEHLRVSLSSSKPLVNYFKGSHRLTLKASMAKLLGNVPFAPASFVLGIQCPRSSKFSSAVRTDDREAFRDYAAVHAETLWIVKPSAGCKGDGIVLVQSAEAAICHVDDVLKGKPGLFVVQKYVSNPLLLEGERKFDIRVWALLVSPYDIYIFSQGSCRTASAKYTRDDTSNLIAHLTNHGLQQKSSDFGCFEVGNELWYAQLDAFLRFRRAASFDETIYPQIRNIVVQSLLLARDIMEIDRSDRFEAFQIFGFDLMIDDTLNVHLLEINGSPGSADRWLKPMMASTLQVVVDKRFPPSVADCRQTQLDRIQSEFNDGLSGTWVLEWSS